MHQSVCFQRDHRNYSDLSRATGVSPAIGCPAARPRALPALRSKMAVCQADGARLGWLLIPHEQAVEVWPASGDPQRFEGRGTPAEASAP